MLKTITIEVNFVEYTPPKRGQAPVGWVEGMVWFFPSSVFPMSFEPEWKTTNVYLVPEEALKEPFVYLVPEEALKEPFDVEKWIAETKANISAIKEKGHKVSFAPDWAEKLYDKILYQPKFRAVETIRACVRPI